MSSLSSSPSVFISLCCSPALLQGPLSLVIPYLISKDIIHFTSTNSAVYRQLSALTFPIDDPIPLSALWRGFTKYPSPSPFSTLLSPDLPHSLHSYAFPRLLSIEIRGSFSMEMFTQIIKQLEARWKQFTNYKDNDMDSDEENDKEKSLCGPTECHWMKEMNRMVSLTHSSAHGTTSSGNDSNTVSLALPLLDDSDLLITLTNGPVIFLPIRRVFSFFRSLHCLKIYFSLNEIPYSNIVKCFFASFNTPFPLLSSLHSFDFSSSLRSVVFSAFSSHLKDILSFRCIRRIIGISQMCRSIQMEYLFNVLPKRNGHHPTLMEYGSMEFLADEAKFSYAEKYDLPIVKYMATRKKNWKSIDTVKFDFTCESMAIETLTTERKIRREELEALWFKTFNVFLLFSKALTSLTMDYLPTTQMDLFLTGLSHPEGRGKRLKSLSLFHLDMSESDCELLGKYFLVNSHVESLRLEGQFPSVEKCDNGKGMSVDQMLACLQNQRNMTSLDIRFTVSEREQFVTVNGQVEIDRNFPFNFGHSMSLLLSHVHSLKYLHIGDKYLCHTSVISFYNSLKRNSTLIDVVLPLLIDYTEDVVQPMIECFHHGTFRTKEWKWMDQLHISDSCHSSLLSSSNTSSGYWNSFTRHVSLCPINGNGNIGHVHFEINGTPMGTEMIQSLITSCENTVAIHDKNNHNVEEKGNQRGLSGPSPFSLSLHFGEKNPFDDDQQKYSTLLSSLSSSLSKIPSITSLHCVPLNRNGRHRPPNISPLLPSLFTGPFRSLTALNLHLFISDNTHCHNVETFFTHLAENQSVKHLELNLNVQNLMDKLSETNKSKPNDEEKIEFLDIEELKTSFIKLSETFYTMVRYHNMFRTLRLHTPFDLFQSLPLFTFASHPFLCEFEWHEISSNDPDTISPLLTNPNSLTFFSILSSFITQNTTLRKIQLSHLSTENYDVGDHMEEGMDFANIIMRYAREQSFMSRWKYVKEEFLQFIHSMSLIPNDHFHLDTFTIEGISFVSDTHEDRDRIDTESRLMRIFFEFGQRMGVREIKFGNSLCIFREKMIKTWEEIINKDKDIKEIEAK